VAWLVERLNFVFVNLIDSQHPDNIRAPTEAFGPLRKQRHATVRFPRMLLTEDDCGFNRSIANVHGLHAFVQMWHVQRAPSLRRSFNSDKVSIYYW
jgi:hypothetical protein